MSRLDYCNSVLYGTSKSNLKKLQHIQNLLVRLVYILPSRSSCQPLLKELSWLPIEKHINFKIALLAFKYRNACAPKYLSDLITNYVPVRSLRSSDSILLTVNRLRTQTARPVVPNLFCSRGHLFYFGGHGGHKVIFLHPPLLLSYLLSSPPTARGLGSIVSSPAGSGAEPHPTTHFRAFYGKK